MKNNTVYSNKFIQRYAQSHGIPESEVDPYETHYVTGLEHLHFGNRSDAFEKLSAQQQQTVLQWIDRTFLPASSTRSCPASSYGLKHWFGNEGTNEQSWWRNPEGFYITNGQFKGAMEAAGYQPDNPNACNPRYKVKLAKQVKIELRNYRVSGHPYREHMAS